MSLCGPTGPVLSLEREAKLVAHTRWVFETCLLHGAQAETAAVVAAHFARGVRAAWLGRAG